MSEGGNQLHFHPARSTVLDLDNGEKNIYDSWRFSQLSILWMFGMYREDNSSLMHFL